MVSSLISAFTACWPGICVTNAWPSCTQRTAGFHIAIVFSSRRSRGDGRSEEHTSELQSLMRISYAVFCLKKKNKQHLKHDDSEYIVIRKTQYRKSLR